MNNEKRPWDDSEDDEGTEMSRVSQTPSTSIFDLSSDVSLYTDTGPPAFPQAPHKIQLDSTLPHPSSAIRQKSYFSQRNRYPLLLPLRSPLLNLPLPCPMQLTISNLRNNLKLSINICQLYLVFHPLYLLTSLISDILSAALDPNVAIRAVTLHSGRILFRGRLQYSLDGTLGMPTINHWWGNHV